MQEEKINDRNKENKERSSTEVSNSTGHQPLKQDAHHEDQQEGNMNNGELGANLPSNDENKKPA